MLKSKQCGDEAEDELIAHLQNICCLSAEKNLTHSLRYFYDVQCVCDKTEKTPESLLTFEVKHDKMASKTGNVAVEHHNSKQDKPSGIMATQAHLWCHKINGVIWVCSVSKLKEFMETTKPLKKIIGGGDKNSNMYIFKIEQFISICKKLEDLVSISNFIDMIDE